MQYPIISDIPTSKEMLTNFQGYDNRVSALEGSFYDEQNMSADNYPTLSVRDRRKKIEYPVYKSDMGSTQYRYMFYNKVITSDGNELITIARVLGSANDPTKSGNTKWDALTYGDKRVVTYKTVDGVKTPSNAKFFPDTLKSFQNNYIDRTVRIGSKLILFPNKQWVGIDGEDLGDYGNLDGVLTRFEWNVSPCKADGTPIEEWHDSTYYEEHDPNNGDYMMTEKSDGTYSLKVYSSYTKSWSSVTSTYVAIRLNGTTEYEDYKIEEGDGVKIFATELVNIGFETTPMEEVEAYKPFVKMIDSLFPNEGEDVLESGYMPGNISSPFVFYHDYYQTKNSRKYMKSTNTIVKKIIKKDNCIYLVVPGIVPSAGYYNTNVPSGIVIARKCPDMSFVVECQNRLWGCSKDGHEIYCCKLGDPKNWNYYSGTAIDSYAATVGSPGEFTGGITYNQNPIFFKENSFIKVSVSSSGAHSYREQPAPGVAPYSGKSVVNINGVIYYLSNDGVYAFDGSNPMKISNEFGNHRYLQGIGGKVNGKYYLSVLEQLNTDTQLVEEKNFVSRWNFSLDQKDKKRHKLFVYDTYKGVWHKHDNGDETIMDMFGCGNTLYMVVPETSWNTHGQWEGKARIKMEGEERFVIAGDTSIDVNYDPQFYFGTSALMYTNNGCSLDRSTPYHTEEKPLDWFFESPTIGYAISDKKYVGKINIRMSLAVGAYADFWIMYDNDDKWTHVFNMSGKGMRSFTIPVTPKRCESFRYKMSGKGECKIISITKSIEEGSDV